MNILGYYFLFYLMVDGNKKKNSFFYITIIITSFKNKISDFLNHYKKTIKDSVITVGGK
jgi:hypothetical protein